MSAVIHQPPDTLRDVSTCLSRKSSFASCATIGMPTWFGAKLPPM